MDAETAAAYQRGFRDGEAKAKSGVVTEMESAIQRMSQSVHDLVPLRARLRRDAESDVVQLALAIARRVLRREMSVDPSAMQALAHVALQKLERQEISRVYVHPNQAAAVKSALESSGVRAEVISELTREPGSLVFETNQGMLDASVKAQLEEIERGLTDRVNQS
jgi:flagellar assembly protein FliH